MTLNYTVLFNIELLHEYFFDRKCNVLSIIPSQDCKTLATSMRLLFRSINNTFITFIQQNESGEPFLNTDKIKMFRSSYGNKVLRFYLKVNDPAFFNYTNLPTLAAANSKLYFSNLSENLQNQILYLSAPVAAYDATKTYMPGDLAMDAATGNIYEAVRKNNPAKKTKLTDNTIWALKGLSTFDSIENYAPGKTYMTGEFVRQSNSDNIFEAAKRNTGKTAKDLSDASVWIPRGKGQLQYAAGNDVISCSNGAYFFQLPAAVKKADVSILAFNFDTKKPAFDVVIKKETRKFDSAVTQVSIDLSTLDPGKYVIKVNDETSTVYYDPTLDGNGILGIIEIYNHLLAKDEFSLLDDNEKIKHAKYSLVFPNRRVLWKYVRKDGRAKSITDTGETGYSFTLDGEEFVSATPIPLSEDALKTLKLEFSSKDFSISPLPNPSVLRLSRHTQDDFDYLCSETYLNY
ncbi:hypothetical protein [Pinibacter aurantiacus]|uniref:Uncharacterized protein n=1 Tax=Pinibacter aurantiacus TaxID=2851599 RepID=A0A9E2SCM4_9BACT|nr:hypothetical protein [Pinibacter aurantiacus]MBV4360531.1 hypothetical protein [Pinibacter aurantiacus]